MKRISIRARFSILIGLFVFVFSILMMSISTNVLRNEIKNANAMIDKNITYIESTTNTEKEDSQVIVEIKPSINKNEMNSNMIPKPERSAEAYKVSINILNETYQKTISKQVFYSLVLGLLGFVTAYPISGLLLKPFNKLVHDINQIDTKNLAYPLYIENPKDEIGKIKIAFNKLILNMQDILERQSNFSSNVAHELKTPLSVMKMYPETLDEDSDIEEYKEVIAIMKKNTNRMSELVDDLFAYSRMEDSQKALLNVKDIIDINVEYLRPLLNEKNINVHLDVKDVNIITNKELMNRLVYNILSNAIRYNKVDGSIYITLKENELSIRDTGIGIPEESLDKIFEPLYCVDKSRSRELGGSGLGLSIVKKICDILGYKIEVSSKVNFGTEFTIKM